MTPLSRRSRAPSLRCSLRWELAVSASSNLLTLLMLVLGCRGKRTLTCTSPTARLTAACVATPFTPLRHLERLSVPSVCCSTAKTTQGGKGDHRYGESTAGRPGVADVVYRIIGREAPDGSRSPLELLQASSVRQSVVLSGSPESAEAAIVKVLAHRPRRRVIEGRPGSTRSGNLCDRARVDEQGDHRAGAGQ